MLKQASKIAGEKESFCLLNLLLPVLWYSLADSQVVSQCDRIQSWRTADWHGSRREQVFLCSWSFCTFGKKIGGNSRNSLCLQSLFLITFKLEDRREKAGLFHILTSSSVRRSYHILLCLLKQGRLG